MGFDLSSISKGQLIRLDRTGAADRFTTGFVVDFSEQLILLHQFHDFLDFGFTILKRRDVADVRRGKYEEAFQKILESEGFQPSDSSLQPAVIDWNSVLQHFVEYRTFISIESEKMGPNCDESSFLVGIPSEVSEGTVWFLGCDATGEWETEEEAIEIPEITAVQFNSPYLKTMYRYMTSS